LRNYLHSEPNQRVLQAIDRLLIARNDARREDDDISGLEDDMRVIVAGDPRKGRARLTLAAGADHHDPVARDVARLILRQKTREVRQVTVLSGGFVDPPQRA